MFDIACDVDYNKTNAELCKANRPGRSYGSVTVTISGHNDVAYTINFRAIGTDGAVHEYTGITWDTQDMWIDCPSSLVSVRTKLPADGASGTLYLSKELLIARGIAGTPKWPRAFADGEPVAPLVIDATSMIVTGTTTADGEVTAGSIDILDATLAAVDQTIVIDGTRRVTVTLKATGYTEFGFLTFPMTITNLEAAIAVILERRRPLDISAAWQEVERWACRLDPVGETQDPDLRRARDLLRKVLEG